MQRLNQVLLGSAAVVALVSGAMMLSTTKASAQFDIGGIIRGAVAHGYYGGGSYRRRGRVHETRRDRHSKEAKEEDKDKQEKADKHEDKQVDQASAGNSGNSNRAEDKGPPPSPPANNSTPQQPATTIPAFSPSR
jgi:hypothetical protein